MKKTSSILFLLLLLSSCIYAMDEAKLLLGSKEKEQSQPTQPIQVTQVQVRTGSDLRVLLHLAGASTVAGSTILSLIWWNSTTHISSNGNVEHTVNPFFYWIPPIATTSLYAIAAISLRCAGKLGPRPVSTETVRLVAEERLNQLQEQKKLNAEQLAPSRPAAPLTAHLEL